MEQSFLFVLSLMLQSNFDAEKVSKEIDIMFLELPSNIRMFFGTHGYFPMIAFVEKLFINPTVH